MLLSTLLQTLTNHKAKDIQVIDVQHKTPLTDTFVICSASSNRHAKSLAELLIKTAKVEQTPPISVEGLQVGEWVLVNLDSIVAHIMLPETRAWYQLDTLWGEAEHTTDVHAEAQLNST